MTNTAQASQPAAKTPGTLGDLAMVGLVVIAVVRCLVSFSSVVSWNLSNLHPSMPGTSIESAGTAVCDALMLVVLMWSLIDAAMRRARVPLSLLVLWLVGVGFVIYHATGSADALRIGGNWVGATALGLAAMILAGQRHRRRFMIAAVIGLIVPLGLNAFKQVAIDHPATVRSYEDNRAQILEQQGIAPGSAGQTKFETRLYPTEASGAFALANVFGSVIGALGLVAIGLAVGAKRLKGRRWWWVALVVLLALATLALTKSKGAVLAFAVAGGAVAALARWRPGWSRSVCLGLVVVGIAAVLVRGLMGPPDSVEGERSLLFRAFYWQGAASMLAERPIAGVGPGEFQTAYMKHKPALSPEDPADPHNVFVAWLSMLGVGGGAWCLMLAGLFAMGVRSAKASDDETAASVSPNRPPLAIICAVLAFGFTYTVHLNMLWIDGAMLLIIGAVSFAVILAGTPARWLDSSAARWGLIAAATMICVHSQIEMGLTNTMSAPLLFVMLGVAAGRDQREQSTGVAAAVLSVLVAALVVGGGLGASRQLQAQESARRAIHLVTGPNTSQIDVFDQATESLDRASRALPTDLRFELMRLELATRRVFSPLTSSGTVRRMLRQISDQYEQLADRHDNPPQVVRAWLWLVDRAMIDPKDDRHGSDWQATARVVVARLEEVAPYGLSDSVRAGNLMANVGELKTAAKLYRRALEIDQRYYLDPDSQLPPAVRKRLGDFLAKWDT